jgi:hypothetical protein
VSKLDRRMRREEERRIMRDEIRIDLAAPAYRLTPADMQTIPGGDPEHRRAFVSQHVLKELVGAKHQRQMNAKDGRVWAAFLNGFAADGADGDGPEAGLATSLTVRGDEFRWLKRIVDDEDLSIPYNLSHWRVTLQEYLDDLWDRAKAKEKAGAGKDGPAGP